MDLRARNKLLYHRAGFGWTTDQYEHPQDIKTLVASLFPGDQPEMLTVVSAEDWVAYNPKALKLMDEEVKKTMQRSFRERTQTLNLLWIKEMAGTQNQLREKMSLFWHGHFACQVNNPYFEQQLLHQIRSNALGNFGTLLKQVSTSPAMLQFLNNQQNKKEHPNENFAREVMELFTLGRGNYSEQDIKEAARAFTGWAYDDEGNFIFRKKNHDDGVKTVLGKTGNFDGNDVLDILLQQPQTALFITQKICRYFVSDAPVNEKRVKELAQVFFKSNYDIALLLRTLFTADWFYEERYASAKVKAPVELLVGYMRTLPMDFKNEKTLLNLQRALGQFLFRPPNVAGWPGGTSWIDSSSLVIRMRLPEAFYASRELNLSLKEIDGEMEGAGKKMISPAEPAERFRVGQVATDWTGYVNAWKEKQTADLPRILSDYLLAGNTSEAHIALARKYADNDSPEELIKSLTILYMKMPEYQLS